MLEKSCVTWAPGMTGMGLILCPAPKFLLIFFTSLFLLTMSCKERGMSYLTNLDFAILRINETAIEIRFKERFSTHNCVISFPRGPDAETLCDKDFRFQL